MSSCQTRSSSSPDDDDESLAQDTADWRLGGIETGGSRKRSARTPFQSTCGVPQPVQRGKGWKVGIESRHRQPQRVLRASSTKAEAEAEEEEESTAELATVKLNPVLFRF